MGYACVVFVLCCVVVVGETKSRCGIRWITETGIRLFEGFGV